MIPPWAWYLPLAPSLLVALVLTGRLVRDRIRHGYWLPPIR